MDKQPALTPDEFKRHQSEAAHYLHQKALHDVHLTRYDHQGHPRELTLTEISRYEEKLLVARQENAAQAQKDINSTAKSIMNALDQLTDYLLQKKRRILLTHQFSHSPKTSSEG
jgi:hypothetical protein